ncbi:unnamed protein product, partial [Rotaria magnacalcarata]
MIVAPLGPCRRDRRTILLYPSSQT